MRKEKGFTLIELMIVVAIIAIIAAIAIPNLLRSRMAANESATVGSMKTVSTQEAIYRQQAETDGDEDGVGEYGWLCELSGELCPRKGPVAIAGGGNPSPCNPIYISQQFNTGGSGGTDGTAEKSGYLYRLYLPIAAAGTDAAADGGCDLYADGTAGGAGAAWGNAPGLGLAAGDRDIANRQEASFALTAWPVELNSTGQRAFFINEVGEAYGTKMTIVTYTGTGTPMPNYGCAYENDGVNDGWFNNKQGAIDAATSTSTANDTNVWNPAG